MDLLGSILNSMDKPPSISVSQKALIKKNREEFNKRKRDEAESLKMFREKVERKINSFLKDDSTKEYTFPPMDKVYRSIIHDVCDVANILAYSFGKDGNDKHIVIFKKEYAPSDDQLSVLRNGGEWNKETAEKLQRQKIEQIKQKDFMFCQKRKVIPNSNYKDKYEHLIGKEAALEAAKKTEANSNYGCVPSRNKKDQRSIEQTLADIKEKRRKLQEQSVNENF